MNIVKFILVLLLFSSGIIARDTPPASSGLNKLYSFHFSYYRGKVLQTNDFISGNNATGKPIDFHQALSFRVAKQTVGRKSWEKAYGYPRYGIGLYAADFKSREIGQPIAVYGFLSGPVIRSGRFCLMYDFAGGLTFNINAYDPLSNPYNTAFGSSLNSFEEVGISLEYKLSQQISLVAGYSQIHYSNGGIVQPNQGINTSSVRASLYCKLYPEPAFIKVIPSDVFQPNSEWSLGAFSAVKFLESPIHTDSLTGPGSLVPCFSSGLIAVYSYQFCPQIRMGAGFTIDYNGINNPQFLLDGDRVSLNRQPDLRRMEISFNTSHELVYDRFSVIVNSGFYLYRNALIKSNPIFYQRAGIKYYFSKSCFAAILLRAIKFNDADFVEWIVGYRF